MADRPQMFAPNRGFSDMVHSMEPCKMLWADPCCHSNEIWANLDYFSTKSPISRLLWQTDRRCLGLRGGRATLVAMATKFGLYAYRLVCLCVCLTLLLQIDSSFLFLNGIVPFFGRQISMWHSTKHCSSIFLFRPPDAHNLLPKICTKSPISRLVWQIDRRCLGLLGGFRGWPIQWNHAKCCWANPCCHGNEICARCRDLVAYRLVITYVSVIPSAILGLNISETRPDSGMVGSNAQPIGTSLWPVDCACSRWCHVTGWRHNGDVMIFP